jgi:hypothetical protein
MWQKMCWKDWSCDTWEVCGKRLQTDTEWRIRNKYHWIRCGVRRLDKSDDLTQGRLIASYCTNFTQLRIRIKHHGIRCGSRSVQKTGHLMHGRFVARHCTNVTQLRIRNKYHWIRRGVRRPVKSRDLTQGGFITNYCINFTQLRIRNKRHWIRYGLKGSDKPMPSHGWDFGHDNAFPTDICTACVSPARSPFSILTPKDDRSDAATTHKLWRFT